MEKNHRGTTEANGSNRERTSLFVSATNRNPTAFFARGVFSDVFLIFGLAALYIARRQTLPAFQWGGLAIGALAIGMSALRGLKNRLTSAFRFPPTSAERRAVSDERID